MVGQAGVGKDRFGGAVERGVGVGHIHPQGTQPLRDQLQRGVGVTVFIDKVACGIDLKAEVVNGIEDRIDEVVAVKQLTGAVVDQAVEACLRTAFVVAVGIDEGLQAGGIGANPDVEGDQVGWGEHERRRSPNRGQAGGDEPIQGIRCGDTRRQGGCIGGAAQTRIPAQPANQLIQSSTGGAGETAGPLGVPTDSGGWRSHGLARGQPPHGQGDH